MSVAKKLAENAYFRLWPSRRVNMNRTVDPRNREGPVSHLECSACLYREVINLYVCAPSLRCPHCGEYLGDDTGNHPVPF